MPPGNQLLREALTSMLSYTAELNPNQGFEESDHPAVLQAAAALSHLAAEQPQPNPLTARCYTMSEPHLSGYRLILGFQTREAVEAAHHWVVCLGRDDMPTPDQSHQEPSTSGHIETVGTAAPTETRHSSS
jgi:hypothetical protein